MSVESDFSCVWTHSGQTLYANIQALSKLFCWIIFVPDPDNFWTKVVLMDKNMDMTWTIIGHGQRFDKGWPKNGQTLDFVSKVCQVPHCTRAPLFLRSWPLLHFKSTTEGLFALWPLFQARKLSETRVHLPQPTSPRQKNL